jgi:hypothetical protein
MTTEPYCFLVSEQIREGARTTSILITEAPSLRRAKQEFFELFGEAALEEAHVYSRQEFVDTCRITVTPWVIDNLENSQRLQPSEFSYKLQIHTRLG